MVVPCYGSTTMVTETVSFCFPYHAGSTMILYMQMIWRNNFLEIWINYGVQSNFHHYTNSFANYFKTNLTTSFSRGGIEVGGQAI